MVEDMKEKEIKDIMDLLEKAKELNVEIGDIKESLIKKIKESLKENERHDFNFKGSAITCSIEGPHPPHVVGYYDTVRFGPLQFFCLGKEGEVEFEGIKRELKIVVEEYEHGDGWIPGRARGFYYYTG